MLKRKCPFQAEPTQKRPKDSEEQHKEIYPEISRKVKRGLKSFKSKKKAMMLIGPEGAGKTILVRSAAKSIGFSLLEIGAGSLRSRSAISSRIKEATQTFAIDSINSGTVIFIDDADVDLSPDKGFYTAVSELIDHSKNPIIMAGSAMPLKLKGKKNLSVLYMTNTDHYIYEFAKSKISEERLRILMQNKLNLHTIVSEINFPRLEIPTVDSLTSADIELHSLALDVYRYNDYSPRHRSVLNCKRSINYRNVPLKEYIEQKILGFEDEQKGNMDVIAREHLLHFGDPTNHIEILQFFKGCISRESIPSHIVRTRGSSFNHLDLFLLKNPNQFK